MERCRSFSASEVPQGPRRTALGRPPWRLRKLPEGRAAGAEGGDDPEAFGGGAPLGAPREGSAAGAAAPHGDACGAAQVTIGDVDGMIIIDMDDM